MPGYALWPGMIQPRTQLVDQIQITDLFTTIARIGGALDAVPDDRVTDGIDATAALLLGNGESKFHLSVDLHLRSATHYGAGFGFRFARSFRARAPKPHLALPRR